MAEKRTTYKYRILRESVRFRSQMKVVTIIAGLAATEVDGVAPWQVILPMSW